MLRRIHICVYPLTALLMKLEEVADLFAELGVGVIPLRNFHKHELPPSLKQIDLVRVVNVNSCDHSKWTRVVRKRRESNKVVFLRKVATRNHKQYQRDQQKRKAGRRNGSQRGR